MASESLNNQATLFITAFHPGGGGAIGAGEAICEESLRGLCSSGRAVHVLSLAPMTQTENLEVAGLCASYTTIHQTRIQTYLALFKGLWHGSLFAPWLFTRVSPRNIRVARELIRRNNVSEVWLDFPPALGFASRLRGLSVDYFAHDVVNQNIGRRKVLGVLSPLVKRVEQNLLGRTRRCYVLSEKDAVLLREMGYVGEILVRPPVNIKAGVVSGAMPVSQILSEFSGRKNLVFFGKMSRPENHWSIMHFLLFAYPKIRRCHEGVQFWILGLLPRFSMRLLGGLIPGVRVVSAVDDPVPAFQAASVCVAPLRLGAGVKIKVLQMLDTGAKVIASPVAAEGIPHHPNLIVVDYAQIPETVCRFLSK